MAQPTRRNRYAQIIGHICRFPDSISFEHQTRLHALVSQTPMIRQTILNSVHDGERIEAFLDEMACIGAEGWKYYLGHSMQAAGLQREYETLLNSIHRDLEHLEEGRRELNKAVKKLNRQIDELQEGTEELRCSFIGVGEHDWQDMAADVLDLDQSHDDLNSLLMQFDHLETDDEDVSEPHLDIRGGMGGQLEDEEHVYSYAKYKNWDEVDQELAAESTEAPKTGTDTKTSGANRSGGCPNDTCSCQVHRCMYDGNDLLGSLEIHMIYLNEGFTVDCCADKHVFETPIIICHFAQGDALKNSTWKAIESNHLKKYGHGSENTCLFRVEMDRVLRQAIAQLGLLDEDLWAPEGQDETYIVTDQSLGPLLRTSIPAKEPVMRGGGHAEIVTPIQAAPSESHTSLTEEFDRIYERLVSNTLDMCGKEQPSACLMAWISVAGILRSRNSHLAQQLEDLKEMHSSVVEDLRWNIDILTHLEDKLDTAEEEKANALVELGFLKKSMEKREEGKHDQAKATEVERPANPTPNQAASRERQVPASPAVDQSRTVSTADLKAAKSQATSFYFYPLRSVIVLPGSPAQILQFPQGTKLRDIRDILIRQHGNGLETDMCAIRVREIIEVRDRMGIDLPESLLDEATLIGIPESHLAHTRADDAVRVAAWETIDGEDYIEFVPRARDNKPSAPVRAVLEYSKDARFLELAHIINSFDCRPDTANEELAESVCSCTLCAADTMFNSTSEMKGPPVVSVRGGGGPYDDDDGDYGYDWDDENEVDHEDEANDTWEEKMPSDQGWNTVLAEISWQPEDANMSLVEESQVHLRGGAGSDGRGGGARRRGMPLSFGYHKS